MISYPDHVMFLGQRWNLMNCTLVPCIYSREVELKNKVDNINNATAYILTFCSQNQKQKIPQNSTLFYIGYFQKIPTEMLQCTQENFNFPSLDITRIALLTFEETGESKTIMNVSPTTTIRHTPSVHL